MGPGYPHHRLAETVADDDVDMDVVQQALDEAEEE